LYPGATEIIAPLESLLTVTSQYISKATESLENEGGDTRPKKAQSQVASKSGRHFTVPVKRQDFVELTGLICAGISKMYPQSKEAVDDFRAEFIDMAFPGLEGIFICDEQTIASMLELTRSDGPLARDLMTLVITLTLAALYRRHMRAGRQAITPEVWGQGHCPVCEQNPHYGLLTQDGARVLECWLCGSQWDFPRLKCVYCHHTEHDQLGYFTVESMDSCRLYFCRQCNQYIKIIDLQPYERQNTTLIMHHLVTLSCDLVATQEGFKAGSQLPWV